jgi:lysozyme family protein
MSKKKKVQTPTLGQIGWDYWQLFLTCHVREEKLPEVTKMVTKINGNRSRYAQVAGGLGSMPWWFVALIHAMEASLNFNKHLHNGDPLSGRTTHVPKGRPVGNPAANPTKEPSKDNPYSWEESAQDALRMKNLHTWTDWTIRASLYKLEAYNGWGYRQYHPTVLSPYLWSYTNHYDHGKYASDGKWSASLVSQQPGAAAILRVMVDQGMVVAIDYMGDWLTSSSPDAEA